MHTIKVYADFIQNKGIDYRKKTLLQINGGTKLLGSAVLINPGSAAPLNEPYDGKFVKEFFKSNHAEESIDLKNWKEFSVDPTMKQLVKLFDGTYATGSPTKLEGVIQLFNCFYIKNHILREAENSFKKDKNNQFQEGDYFKDKPVYFGWGQSGRNGFVTDIAQRIFNDYKGKHKKLYNPTFEANSFYHPRYVNIAYTRNEAVKKVADDFFKVVKKAGSISK